MESCLLSAWPPRRLLLRLAGRVPISFLPGISSEFLHPLLCAGRSCPRGCRRVTIPASISILLLFTFRLEPMLSILLNMASKFVLLATSFRGHFRRGVFRCPGFVARCHNQRVIYSSSLKHAAASANADDTVSRPPLDHAAALPVSAVCARQTPFVTCSPHIATLSNCRLRRRHELLALTGQALLQLRFLERFAE